MLFIMPRPEPVLAAMLQGVTLKVKLAWANANFEFPTVCSPTRRTCRARPYSMPM